MDKLVHVFRKKRVTVTGVGGYTLYSREPSPDATMSAFGVHQPDMDMGMVRALQIEHGLPQVILPVFPLTEAPEEHIGAIPFGEGLYSIVKLTWGSTDEDGPFTFRPTRLHTVKVDHGRRLVGGWLSGGLNHPKGFLHEVTGSLFMDIQILEEDGTPAPLLN